MRSITVCGTSLFKVAADEFGDATLWIDIAGINQLRDPFVEGVMTLRLPSQEALQGDAFAPQR